jgi:hypothetical protein
LPSRGFGAGGQPPPVLSDIARKRGAYSFEAGSTEGLGHIWRDGMTIMMNEVCMCRIFCDPKFHDVLVATFEQNDLSKIVRKELGIQ